MPWSFSLIACAKYACRPLPRCCLTLLTGTQDFWPSYLALLCSGQHSLRQSHRICLPPVPWTVRPVMCRSVCRVLFRATGWPRRALSCRRFRLRICFRTGCYFRSTTYRSSDYDHPSGKYGQPLHHPRFLEWFGALESARLLELGPDMWIHSLSREQAIDAACQLYWDVCLLTTNLNVLDKYVLCLQGTS